LPIWLSDALCRLASGGSFAVRRLYSDDEEVLFEAARPILLNGIEEVISRPDLGDRAIFLTLAPIDEALRRPEFELWREFEIARPRILGALLDAAVHGLRTMDRVHLDRLPRMADFALWAAACETALWPAGTLARAYAANRRTAIEGMIEADPVASGIRGFMAERSGWTGSAADLLRAADFAGNEVWKTSAGWPKTPRALAGRLRRAQTFLRTLGIEVTFSRQGRAGTRMISVSTSAEPPSAPSAGSAIMGLDWIKPSLLVPKEYAAIVRTMLTVLTQTPPLGTFAAPVTNARAAHRQRADAGHDLAVGQMPVVRDFLRESFQARHSERAWFRDRQRSRLDKE
jgi:hypothetical protein